MKKIILLLIVACLITPIETDAQGYAHQFLAQALIAETSCMYSHPDYEKLLLAITCCVRNRIDKGMSVGLVAMKRKDFKQFVKKETRYINAKGKQRFDLVAESIVKRVFEKGEKDVTRSADHYESNNYSQPSWADDMDMVYEIADHKFWRSK